MRKKLKVLIACEYSGITRDAFARLGHFVMSCDLLDTEVTPDTPQGLGSHYKGNVLDVLEDGWDLLIGHPPCQYLSYAGNSAWDQPGRIQKRLEALEFFRQLWEAPISMICLENPAGCASPVIAKYTQEIQPFFFGDNERKRTWLWLKNLEKLRYTRQDDLFTGEAAPKPPEPWKVSKRKNGLNYRHYFMTKEKNAKERARSWPGIARAMAEQWG